jgi:hypothetical protein
VFEEQFEEWLIRFMAFKQKASVMLSANVPDEITELKFEGQKLEPLLFEAEEHAAESTRHYYEAKGVHMRKLDLKEWPKSGLEAPAKAFCHQQLWAREMARGLVRTIVSRGFRISQSLKSLGEK